MVGNISLIVLPILFCLLKCFIWLFCLCVQVVFEGVRGQTYRADIAIDDISILQGACPSSGLFAFYPQSASVFSQIVCDCLFLSVLVCDCLFLSVLYSAFLPSTCLCASVLSLTVSLSIFSLFVHIFIYLSCLAGCLSIHPVSLCHRGVDGA